MLMRLGIFKGYKKKGFDSTRLADLFWLATFPLLNSVEFFRLDSFSDLTYIGNRVDLTF